MTSLATLLAARSRPDLVPRPGFTAVVRSYVPAARDLATRPPRGQHWVWTVLERTAVVAPLKELKARRLARLADVLVRPEELEWIHTVDRYLDPETGRRRSPLWGRMLKAKAAGTPNTVIRQETDARALASQGRAKEEK